MSLLDDEERGCLWTLVEEVQLARDAGTRMGLPDQLWDELDQLIPVVTMGGRSSRWGEPDATLREAALREVENAPELTPEKRAQLAALMSADKERA